MHKFTSVKKLTSIVLAVLIAFSCVVVGVSAASNVKVAFTNNKGWDKVYVYTWDSNDNALQGEWPGTQLTNSAQNDYGESVFYAEIPSNADGVVFTAGNSGPQTVDIDFNGQTTGWYCTDQTNGKWNVGTWDYKPDGGDDTQTTTKVTGSETTATTKEITGGKTVYFTNNKGWNVYAYAWDDKDNDVTKSWPGEAMTKAFTNDFGEDVYKITLPANAAGVVFSNNGGEQTVDLTPADNTGYYPESQNNGKWECGTWSPVVENPSQETTTTKEITGSETTTKKVDTDSYTVYFTNNKGWNVYAYAWDKDDNDVTKAWPGEAMTKAYTNDYGEDVYKITLPKAATGVVFSNNGGDQTVDLTPADNTGYYPTSQNNGKWECGTWSPVVEEPSETTKPVGETTTAPVETTTAPVETTTAPVETTTAPIIPQFQSGLKCSSYSLSLGNNIAINFKVKPANLTGYTNPYLIVTMNGEETRIDNYTTQSDGTIIFEFDKVYPQNVIDTASAVLYATKDNQVYYGEPYEKSVIGYADKYQDETLGSQNLAGLLVNLLRYATECQKLIGYKTDTLAETHIVRSAKRYSSTTLADMVNVKNYSAVKCPGTAKCEWKSATLSLGSSVEIKVNFTAAEMENKSVKVEFNGASYVFGPEYLARNEKYPDRVTFIYDGLYANQMHDTVSFTVMEGDTPVSDTMTYSIASYASQYYNDPSVGNLVTQMMLYGQQAEKYALNG